VREGAKEFFVIITCISDLHGFKPELPGGDLLLIAGDLTAKDSESEYMDLIWWLYDQVYEKIVCIGGNHDNAINDNMIGRFGNIHYLKDSGTEFNGLKIWGSPWTRSFLGMNPKCMAYTVEKEIELAEKWSLIPDDTDILITHTPAYGIFCEHANVFHFGSESLRRRIDELDLKLSVCGHIHESYGRLERDGTIFVNASQVDSGYNFVHEPITIDLK
jgi:Icc-related predicted phosphoesterase